MTLSLVPSAESSENMLNVAVNEYLAERRARGVPSCKGERRAVRRLLAPEVARVERARVAQALLLASTRLARLKAA
jgi:hypothetical protein